jgi:2-polyprenyl-3-methyl-5-hydroxy-6-metoxy-1,4-benzoquinol methylase
MKHCIICGNQNQELIYDNLLIRCPECGFVTANLEIESQDFKAIYSEKYFKGEAYDDYIRDKADLQQNFRSRIVQLGKIIPPEKLEKILEIGCAYGFFGELATKAWKTDYTGIDIAREAIEYAKSTLNLNVFCGDYLQSFKQGFTFDTVFMWDVIEHLANPMTVVERISNEISRGGFIVITTGDIGAFLPKLQGRKWRMIVPPIHLHYFNKKSITKLLAGNGFDVIDISYPAVSRSLRQIFYALFILKREKCPVILKKIYEIIPEKMNISLNTFDIMMVVARKA